MTRKCTRRWEQREGERSEGGGEIGRKASQEGGELLPAGKSMDPVGPWDLNICATFLLEGCL